jgi:repressor protein CI
MDTKEIRRANLRLLAEQYGGQRALADKADIVPSQLSHIIGMNPIRNLGEQLARKIERNLGLSTGFLDQPSPVNLSENAFPLETSIYLPLIKVSVSSNSNSFELKKIADGALTKKWLLDNGVSSEKVFEYDFSDNNMSPNLIVNDRLIVDAAQNEWVDANVFLVCMNGRLYVKRFFRLIGDEFRLSSDNVDKALFPDLIIPFSKMGEIRIVGRVITVLRNLF